MTTTAVTTDTSGKSTRTELDNPDPNDNAAAEAQMARIMTELGAALGVLLTALGVRSGLWAALAGSGPLTAAEVAERVSVDPALVREWLCAQAAGEYLSYDERDQTFVLPDGVAAAVLYGPGGAIVDSCATQFASMGACFGEFSDAFSSGRGFGWHERTADHWHGTDSFTRLALPSELIAAIIDAMGDVPAKLAAGGKVADIGCGYGAPTLAISELFPGAQVTGFDYHDASVATARSAAAEADIGSVAFEVASATDWPGTGYDLITFFDSLHDLGDPGGALVRARENLGPDGSVLLVEPASGDNVSDNLNPSGRMFYAISTLACTPNAVSQRTSTSVEPLGAQAGETRLRALAAEAGLSRVRRLEVGAPMNLVLELRP